MRSGFQHQGLAAALVNRPIAASPLGLSSCRQKHRLLRSRCGTGVTRQGPVAQLGLGSRSETAGRGQLVVSVTPYFASARKQPGTSAACAVLVFRHGPGYGRIKPRRVYPTRASYCVPTAFRSCLGFDIRQERSERPPCGFCQPFPCMYDKFSLGASCRVSLGGLGSVNYQIPVSLPPVW
jgi:hypothetical protein